MNQLLYCNTVYLDVLFNSQNISVVVEKDTTLQELQNELEKKVSICTSINEFQCYSEQKQTLLQPQDNFEYTFRDKLIFFQKQEFRILELMIQLHDGDVKKNIKVSLCQNHTILDIQQYLNTQLESKIFEIYKDGILQSDETITVSQLLNFKQTLQDIRSDENLICIKFTNQSTLPLDEQQIQPFIVAKSVSQIKYKWDLNKLKVPNKQQNNLSQNNFNILPEIYLLKEFINSKFKNLELQFMKILQDLQKNIINQFQQLLDQSFIEIKNDQCIQQKVISFRQQKEITLEHIQKIFTEFEKLQFNLSKEQQELQKKIEKQQNFQLNYVDENKKIYNTYLEINGDCTFLDLLEYLELNYPSEFSQYQTLGPLKGWIGFSTNLGRDVKLSEEIMEYPKDNIKFGPIYIILGQRKDYIVHIQFYGLKNIEMN